MNIKEFTMTDSNLIQEECKQTQHFGVPEATVDAESKTLSQVLAKNVHRWALSQPKLTTAINKIFQGGDLKTYEQVMEEFVKLLTFRELIGIQPMISPVGTIFYLGYKKGDKKGDKKLALDVKKAVVEARTKKYAPRWTLEAQQDFVSMLGLDITFELRQALFSEMATELAAQCCRDLHHVATGHYRLSHKDDKFAEKLIVSITRASSEIARKTRRGKANWVVCSPTTFTVLESAIKAKGVKWEPCKPEKGMGGPAPMLFCGTLPDHGIRVYTHIFAKEDALLLGYKGTTSEIDTGMIWSPYILILTTGMTIDPMTFSPVIDFAERSGKFVQENGGDYYAVIEIDDLDLSLSIEDEMAQALSAEIVQEIDVDDNSSYSEDVRAFLDTFKSTPSFVRKDMREGENRLLNWPQNKQGIYGLVTNTDDEPLSLFAYELQRTPIAQKPFVNPTTFEPTEEPAILVRVKTWRVDDDPSTWRTDENIHMPFKCFGLTEEEYEEIVEKRTNDPEDFLSSFCKSLEKKTNKHYGISILLLQKQKERSLKE